MLILTSLSFSAMVLFCLAMAKHREQVFEDKISIILVLFFKPFAWLLLSLTGYLSVDMYGWSIGPALLFGAITIAILSLTLLLTYRAKIVPQFAIIMLLIASMYMFIA
jgi:hypothetical protein